MKRRFVICVNEANKEQQDIITQFFRESSKLGFWHWFSDVWLVTDQNNDWTATKLRDKMNSLIPGAHKLVIQIDGQNTWATFGKKKSFRWLQKTWSKD
jgi:hypothetical protein